MRMRSRAVQCYASHLTFNPSTIHSAAFYAKNNQSTQQSKQRNVHNYRKPKTKTRKELQKLYQFGVTLTPRWLQFWLQPKSPKTPLFIIYFYKK